MSQFADTTDKLAQRARNVRMALILASIAAAFFVGFVVKITLLGKA
ncbi:cytochrome oxidase small assembly protein [Aquabacterium sp. UBA2148]|nr:cytochrome oxidase small assembly protein [Aquabacterium sp. UBA2148]